MIETRLAEEQIKALKVLIAESDPVLVTGSAGTGKSVLLRAYLQTFEDESQVAVAAPTGIAAQNIGGMTLHSLFGFPIDGILYGNRFRKSGSDYFKNLKCLVIDEVSMVRSDIMNMVDLALKYHTGSEEPFGGIKLVMFGDPYQLPPVLRYEDVHTRKDKYGHKWRQIYNQEKYFFASPVFRANKMRIRILELETIHRQREDKTFAEVLNRIRKVIHTDADLDYLSANSARGHIPDDSPRLFGKNDAVFSYNNSRLDALPSQIAKTYSARWFSNPEVSGTPVRANSGQPENPADAQLTLKVGARVIFIKNDDQSGSTSLRRWVNGSLGTVLKLLSDGVEVRLDNGQVYEVGRSLFDVRELVTDQLPSGKKRIYSDITGWYQQLPLRLGWAITVHKSQGQTLDRAVLDFNDQYFEEGQAYVALSRARSLASLHFITSPTHKEIFSRDLDVVRFMKDAEAFPFESLSPKQKMEQDREALLARATASGFLASQVDSAIGPFVRASRKFTTENEVIKFLLAKQSPQDFETTLRSLLSL